MNQPFGEYGGNVENPQGITEGTTTTWGAGPRNRLLSVHLGPDQSEEADQGNAPGVGIPSPQSHHMHMMVE